MFGIRKRHGEGDGEFIIQRAKKFVTSHCLCVIVPLLYFTRILLTSAALRVCSFVVFVCVCFTSPPHRPSLNQSNPPIISYHMFGASVDCSAVTVPFLLPIDDAITAAPPIPPPPFTPSNLAGTGRHRSRDRGAFSANSRSSGDSKSSSTHAAKCCSSSSGTRSKRRTSRAMVRVMASKGSWLVFGLKGSSIRWPISSMEKRPACRWGLGVYCRLCGRCPDY